MAFNDGGDNAPPGAAAIAYTIDKEMRLEGNYWYYDMNKNPVLNPNNIPIGSDSKPETPDEKNTIQLVRNFKKAINGFCNSSRQSPKQCYIYRGGASDGELSKIKKLESEAFEKAMRELNLKFPFCFMVVVQKSLNRMFRPQINPSDRAPQQNVRAGAVIVNELTHPGRTEFLMQSHKSIQVRYYITIDKTSYHILSKFKEIMGESEMLQNSCKTLIITKIESWHFASYLWHFALFKNGRNFG